MVVVLPAPFGPRNPKISPLATRKSRFRTAWVPANVLVSPVVSIAGPGGVAGGASGIQVSTVVVLRHRSKGEQPHSSAAMKASKAQPSGLGAFRGDRFTSASGAPSSPSRLDHLGAGLSLASTVAIGIGGMVEVGYA